MRVEHDGIGWWVEVTGEGPPLVLLHGFSEGIAPWRPLIERLAVYRRVVAVELLGHGASDAPRQVEPYRLDRVLAALDRILEHLRIERFRLLGYSLGGRIALHWALAVPERIEALVAVSASPGIDDPAERETRREADEALAARIEEIGIEAFAAYWEGQALFAGERALPEEERRRLRTARLAHSPAGLAGVLRGLGQGALPPLRRRLRELAMPVGWIVGENDEKYVRIAGACARENPRIRVTVVPGAGHAVHREAPERFLEAVERFLSEERVGRQG